MFSKFMGSMRPPPIRLSASKENLGLLADKCDAKSFDHQQQSPTTEFGFVWRYARQMNGSQVKVVML